MENNFGDFNSVLETERNNGKVICNITDMTTGSQGKAGKITKVEVVKFLDAIGLKSHRIKEKWERINRGTAGRIIEYILSSDMAYDLELRTKPISKNLSDYFLSQFTTEVEYYTNGKFDKESGIFRLRSWTSLTNSTFDTGVLVIDMSKIGILWAEDND
ncbi:hypothetical protein ACOI1C_12720 [Bacillus sp. DJP31]|uniref:hypothetical protein n=1 Tax=Bacillus sp. DJP31 TaxID=3409789 RepID=UPI003BB8067E